VNRLFGVVLSGECDERPRDLDLLADGMRQWGVHTDVQRDARCALATVGTEPVAVRRTTDDALLAFGGRLTERKALAASLGVGPGEAAEDPDLVVRAYQKWGSGCVSRLTGQWALAAWEPTTRRLTLARCAFGDAPLFYTQTSRGFAFASSIGPLLALPGVSRRLDDLHLAATLTAWPTAGDSTAYASIRRLPPGHTLEVRSGEARLRGYWDISSVAPLRASLDDCVEGLWDVWTRAVADAVAGASHVGLLLSGGLDSGAIAAAVTPRARSRGLDLTALTHVPRRDDVAVGRRIANEWALAQMTARASGIASLIRVDRDVSPVSALRLFLQQRHQPLHGAENLYWLHDALSQAREAGVDRLLTGRGGNGSISWAGERDSLGWRALVRRGLIKPALMAALPWTMRQRVRRARRRLLDREPWRAPSAISAGFSRRMQLADRMTEGAYDRLETGTSARLRALRDGGLEWRVGPVAYEMDLRDPALDDRVATFCLSIPAEHFVGPTGERRWVAKQMLSRRLPPDVVFNSRRGRQAADLVYRLRAHAADVEAALAQCDRSEAVRDRLDVAGLRSTWRDVQTRADDRTRYRAGAVLMRGLMVGLFIGADS
jgi:asparagine synthase (glutamine-hydrolysing)